MHCILVLYFIRLRSVADPYHLIQIRIKDLKKIVTDPDSGRILIWIRIQAKTIRIVSSHKWIQYKEFFELLKTLIFHAFCV